MVADHYGLHDHRYVQGRCGTDINYLCCHLGLIFGSRPSTGILLPMLIVADICAVYYYKGMQSGPFSSS